MITSKFVRLTVSFLLLMALAMASGCATNVPFDFFQEGYKPRGGSIAVLSGATDGPDVRLAEFVTKRLQEKSTLKVLSQAEVERRVGKYPVNVKIGEPKDPDKPVWYLPGEKAKVDAMHNAVKTDYVLVVWVDGLSRITSRNGVSYGASIIGNLLEYSPGKPVGYSNFGRSRSQSCFLFGGTEGKDIDALLQGSAEDLVEQFVERTKTARK